MTTTWNASKPALGNQINADIPDIQENFLLIKDILEAITTGTLGTTDSANYTVDVLASGAYVPDGGTLGSATTVDAITIASNGDVTLKEDLVIGDGKLIGSASDLDAISISSGGDVTFTQDIVMASGKLIGITGDIDLLTLTSGNLAVAGTIGCGSVTTTGDYLLVNGNYIGVSAAERIEFHTSGYVSVMGANFGAGTVTPTEKIEASDSGNTEIYIRTTNTNLNAQTNLRFMRGTGVTSEDNMALIRALATNVTGGSEASDLILSVRMSSGLTEVMRLAGAGGDVIFAQDIVMASGKLIGITGDLDLITLTADTVTVAGTVAATAISGGTVTSTGNMVIADAGTIGSASDLDAIAIASDGKVTLTQILIDALGMVIGDTAAESKTTLGLTINQGANDDAILALQSSDIAHGITTIVDTDTFGIFRKVASTDGGLGFVGIAGGTGKVGVYAQAIAGAFDSTTSNSAWGCFTIDVSEKSGTATANPGVDDNCFVVKHGGATPMIVKGDGDIYTDQTGGLAGTYDAEDDISLAMAAKYNMTGHYDHAWKTFTPRLQELGIMKGPFYSHNKMNALQLGAIGQMADKMRQLDERMEGLENEIRSN